MKIFYADVTVLAQKNAQGAGMDEISLERLPDKRREQIARYRHENDRLRGIGAGLLLEYGLNGYGLTLTDAGRREGYALAELSYGAHGKPYLTKKGICFNLSHAGNYAAAVFSEDEAGIDIEKLGKAKQGVAERFFDERERENLAEAKTAGADNWDRRFAWIWTRKESYIKAVGTGLTMPLDSFDVLAGSVGGEYTLNSFFEPEGYCLSVCAKEHGEVCMQQIDFMEILGRLY